MNAFEAGVRRCPIGHPTDLVLGPISTEFASVSNEGVEIDFAGRDQRDVPGAVTALEIALHGLDLEVLDALLCAQHAMPQGMLAEVPSADQVIGPEGRLIEVHLNFFDDD